MAEQELVHPFIVVVARAKTIIAGARAVSRDASPLLGWLAGFSKVAKIHYSPRFVVARNHVSVC